MEKTSFCRVKAPKMLGMTPPLAFKNMSDDEYASGAERTRAVRDEVQAKKHPTRRSSETRH
jgi:hypothetical protein